MGPNLTDPTREEGSSVAPASSQLTPEQPDNCRQQLMPPNSIQWRNATEPAHCQRHSLKRVRASKGPRTLRRAPEGGGIVELPPCGALVGRHGGVHRSRIGVDPAHNIVQPLEALRLQPFRGLL